MEQLRGDVALYLERFYIDEKKLAEKREAERKAAEEKRRESEECYSASQFYQPVSLPKQAMSAMPQYSAASFSNRQEDDINEMLKQMDEGFSERLLQLIDERGLKDSAVYKKANVDRKLFSKIRNNPDYRPSKQTAVAFAIALELNLEETRNFLERAGYALSKSSKFDVIVEYFITHKNYNIHELNEILYSFDQQLIGA